PRSMQRVLWSYVVGTDQQGYVANPDRGSVHNFGLAIDLTAADEQGRPLDMGSAFDSFHAVSEPRKEQEFLQAGVLNPIHLENRQLLRRAMTSAGFIQLPHEWWHYDALPREEIRSGFEIVE